ncbi:hypothetical protein RA307_30600 [Xanthobacteraceae bacterium Astr-EGSB]|uniref:hypothetical protein n=1 Tax=Astrobacterium formosum TaxID=3069710 RepID=UPI0027B37389|nr:hypothetical protein [Xanthobacteraceae bacterium Astr-EGSB]
MDEPWREEFDDLDNECLAAQTMAVGAIWPSVAVAYALIDKGLIDKRRLLEIIDSLHTVVAGLTAGDLGDVEDRLRGLELMREFLEFDEVQPDRVLEFLRTTETAQTLLLLLQSKPPRPTRE